MHRGRLDWLNKPIRRSKGVARDASRHAALSTCLPYTYMRDWMPQ